MNLKNYLKILCFDYYILNCIMSDIVSEPILLKKKKKTENLKEYKRQKYLENKEKLKEKYEEQKEYQKELQTKYRQAYKVLREILENNLVVSPNDEIVKKAISIYV